MDPSLDSRARFAELAVAVDGSFAEVVIVER